MGVTFLMVLLVLIQASGPPEETPARVYLGPLPSADGFIRTNKDFEDSYRDLRNQYKGNRDIQQVLQLVDRWDEADVVLELVDRGMRDTGIRSGSAAVIGTAVVGSSAPIRQKWLLARLVVPGTDYVVELDGHAGIRLVNYRQQARNILRQTAEWVKAKVREVEVPV